MVLMKIETVKTPPLRMIIRKKRKIIQKNRFFFKKGIDI